MKKFLYIFICSCFVILGCLSFAGCGEQFIEERTYQLVNMQVIRDKTPNDGNYSNFEDGVFTNTLTGSMKIDQVKVAVGKQSSTLIFDDSQNTGFVVRYVFDVYTSMDVYPAYSFSSYEIKLDGVNIENISETEISDFSLQVKELYQDIMQFTNVLTFGQTSIQLVTQNKSFACSIIILDNNDNFCFMAMLYGY